MSDIKVFSNPGLLDIARLREHLDAFNISYNPKAKKAQLVAVYKSKLSAHAGDAEKLAAMVSGGTSPPSRSRAAGHTPVRSKPRSSRLGRGSSTRSKPVGGVPAFVSAMSDEELVNGFRALQVVPPPISAASRALAERKYTELLDELDDHEEEEEEEEIEEEEEEDEVDDDITFSARATHRTTAPRVTTTYSSSRTTRSSPRRTKTISSHRTSLRSRRENSALFSDPEDDGEVVLRRSKRIPPAKRRAEEAGGPSFFGFKLTLLLIALLILAVAFYLHGLPILKTLLHRDPAGAIESKPAADSNV